MKILSLLFVENINALMHLLYDESKESLLHKSHRHGEKVEKVVIMIATLLFI